MNIDEVGDLGKEILNKTGSLMMQFILITGKTHEAHVVAKHPDDEVIKEIIRGHMQKYMETRGITHYFLMHEAWLAQNVFGGRPSEQPGKREAMVVSEFKKGEKNKTKIFFYRRENDKIIWEEDMPVGDSVSRYDVFKENVVEEYIGRERVRIFREAIQELGTRAETMFDELAKVKRQVTGMEWSRQEIQEDLEEMVRKGRIMPGVKPDAVRK